MICGDDDGDFFRGLLYGVALSALGAAAGVGLAYLLAAGAVR